MKHANQTAGLRLLAILGCLALAACGGSDGGGNGDGNSGGTNAKPTADAGDPQTVDAGVTVTLEGAGSDSDGEIAGYAWTQTDGTKVTLTAGDDGTATFTAPSVDAASELAFKLTVTDDGGKSASDEVIVTVAPVIAMSGRVYDSPLAGANVTVTIGERTYTATADGDGYYTVNVGSVDPEAFITITATGGEGQEHVELVSIAASFATLQAAAGEDGVLEDGESGTVDVTNLSTAKAVLMIEANDGEPITSETQAVAAEKNVNGDEMIRLATVIKLVVDGGFDLPEGVESTLDLVDDTATAETFIETVETADADAFEQVQAAMLADDELFDTYDASDVPAAYNLLLVNTLDSTGTIEYMYGARAPRYEFNSDGTGHLYSSDSDNSGDFAWDVIDGEIVMTFATPLLSQGFCNVEGIVEQVRCDSSTSTRHLRLLLDGVEADQLQVRSIGYTVYPNDPVDPTRQYPFDSTSSWVALDSHMSIDFASEETGTWALAVAGPDLSGLGTDALAAGLMTFEDDGTGGALATDFAPALAFTWAVSDDGSVAIDFADGSALIVRGLRREGIAYDAQLVFTDKNGEVFTDAGLVVRMDGSVGDPGPENIAGFYTLFGQHPYFSIILREDGTALNRNYVPGAAHVDTPITWTLDGDGDIVMSYRVDVNDPADFTDNTPVASCDGLPEADCLLWRQRIWTPIAVNEAIGRVYVRETQVNYNYDGTQPENRGAANFVQTSVRFWDVSDTSLDGDNVLGKPSASKARRVPWVSLPPGTRLVEE